MYIKKPTQKIRDKLKKNVRKGKKTISVQHISHDHSRIELRLFGLSLLKIQNGS